MLPPPPRNTSADVTVCTAARFWLLTVGLLFFFSFPVLSQPSVLFETRHPASLSLDDWQRNQIQAHAAKEYAASVLPATINTRANDILRGGLKSLTFLIDDDTVVFHVTDVKQDKRRKIISGYTNTSDVDGLLVYDPAEKTLAGSFVHDGDPVLIEPIGEGVSSVFRMNGNRLAEMDAERSRRGISDLIDPGSISLSAGKSFSTENKAADRATVTDNVIKVLYVRVYESLKGAYTKEYYDASYIHNQALENAGVSTDDARFQGVGYLKIASPEAFSDYEDEGLSGVYWESGLFKHPSVQKARYDNQADLVVFMVPFPISGAASLGVSLPYPDSESYPYTLVLKDAADTAGYWTTTHELGHLLGVYHEKFDSFGNISSECANNFLAHCRSYPHGYATVDSEGNPINTVVATGKEYDGYATRRLIYSTPTRNFPGTNLRAGNASYADAARTIRNNANAVSTFWENELKDGDTKHSSPSLVQSVQNQHEVLHDVNLSVYPNPMKIGGVVSLSTNEPLWGTIEVIDLLGRVRDRMYYGTLPQGVHDFQISANLPSGTYAVRFRNDTNIKSRLIQVIR